ncbi:hypothetical protein V500_08880 [Pseudogymnoascus sp. VKM F-4518 (FW-2643)]|nr:hypothetical protein V500_08880 [Pseudogymnoascus sp. VKM F-4518 (FW-2643)]
MSSKTVAITPVPKPEDASAPTSSDEMWRREWLGPITECGGTAKGGEALTSPSPLIFPKGAEVPLPYMTDYIKSLVWRGLASGIQVQGATHDEGISAIKDRLDHLYGLVSTRLIGQEARIFEEPPGYLPELPPLREYPLDESIISRHWRKEFPFMTIQTPSMMCLLDLNPKLAAQLVAKERTDVSALSTPSEALGFAFQYEDAIRAFGAFYDRMHHWYPIFSSETFGFYLKKLTSPLIPSSDACLLLLVSAIGSIAQCSSLTAAYNTRPDSRYISKALFMLPNVLVEFSLTSVQCLILLSVYYCFIAKPCQAHDYILMASSKAQAILKCRLFEDDERQSDMLRRSFWSILLIESDLSYHIDMPESNIWKFDDRILLPGVQTSWQPCHEDQRKLLYSMRPTHSFGMPSDTVKAYFLAQIAMCRMMRRCTSSVIISQGQELYSPVVAMELTYQLDTWHNHLPPSIRFEHHDVVAVALPDDFVKSVNSSPTSSVIAVTRFLQMQYYLCLAGIYWPAVYSVISTGTLESAPMANCERFFESYFGFVITAASVIPNSPHNPWSIYANLFITTMACFKGANDPCLRSTIRPDVRQCFAIAAELFEIGDAANISPAIVSNSKLSKSKP